MLYTRRGLVVAALASERVYSDLKERIILGDIAGNTLLSEGEIADQLGVSRTPVREAFLRLQAEGWMHLYPKRGALVEGVDSSEGNEILEARRLIESWAASRLAAAPALLTKVADELETTLISQEAALAEEPDLQAFIIADLHFHQLLVESAGNRILTAVYRQLSDRQRRMTAYAVKTGSDRPYRVLQQHHDLLDALRTGDPHKFVKALDHHFNDIHGASPR
ncbi:GntR family transcriptional regulator [Pseudoclavibacter sp. 13-3]|uniref:GntR family transcriptional regulator n=1 Tax=Pseudoclavibacter sp. 13-3 TaxID=2901228 RepID=UPI001E5DB13E|nr:GntR family transcriptional regulator [Pseudoclavibacter sp. 13-3]MCD7101064.1 GntR family transcriptional regulator [Pseudoclavibacter sp. 13-3]